jgi:zeaxanthin glucosyltransferase
VNSLDGIKIGIALRPAEPGHQACGVALAKRLSACGAHVTFIGMADDRANIDASGFAFLTLSERAAPLGTVPRETERARQRSTRLGAMVQDVRWLMLHKRIIDALPESLASIRATALHLVICDIGELITAFVALGMSIPCVILETTVPMDNEAAPPTWTRLAPNADGSLPLRARLAWRWENMGRFQDSVAPLFGLGQRQLAARLVGSASPIRTFGEIRRQLPRIVACPAELDFPGPRAPHWFYVDALVDLERANESFCWDGIPRDRALVYLAMGTQTWLIRERDRLYGTFLEAASLKPRLHFVLAAGDAMRTLRRAPKNMTVLERVPQMAVLSRAAAMVTHAGLNSVKECISMGVPMVALPVDRDQPGNAARIAYHKLGVVADYHSLRAAELCAAIDEVLQNPVYRQSTQRMRHAFETSRRRNEVIDVIAGCLPRPTTA